MSSDLFHSSSCLIPQVLILPDRLPLTEVTAIDKDQHPGLTALQTHVPSVIRPTTTLKSAELWSTFFKSEKQRRGGYMTAPRLYSLLETESEFKSVGGGRGVCVF